MFIKGGEDPKSTYRPPFNIPLLEKVENCHNGREILPKFLIYSWAFALIFLGKGY